MPEHKPCPSIRSRRWRGLLRAALLALALAPFPAAADNAFLAGVEDLPLNHGDLRYDPLFPLGHGLSYAPRPAP